MLDKRLKTILDVLIAHGFSSSKTEFISIESTLIPMLPDKYKDSWENLSPAVSFLVDADYLSGELFYHGYYPVPDYRDLSLTYKGSHYKNFQWQEFRKDMFRSIAVPIIVSLITAAITTAIGYLWGKTTLFHQSSEDTQSYYRTYDCTYHARNYVYQCSMLL